MTLLEAVEVAKIVAELYSYNLITHDEAKLLLSKTIFMVLGIKL